MTTARPDPPESHNKPAGQAQAQAQTEAPTDNKPSVPSLDPARAAALYVEHADELRAFLTGVLKDRELAGEALQATFARTVEVGHTAREETLKGWIFRVAFNEAMALKRRRKVDRKAVAKLNWFRPNRSETRESESPEDNLARWETVDRVRSALETLPEEQEHVVRLRIYEELTFAEIAEATGAPLGTVLTRMRLALKKLKTTLDHPE